MSNFITRMFNLNNTEKRNDNPVQPEQGFNAIGLSFGDLFSDTTGMQLSAVFASIEMIANGVAQLPIHFTKIDKDGNKEIITNHPAYLALHEGELSKYMLIKMLITDMYLYGDGYAYLKRTSNGDVSDIIYLKHGQVQSHYNELTREHYYIIPAISSQKKIFEKDLIHLYKNSYNGHEGVSVLNYASKTLSLAKISDKAAHQFFSGGSNLSGILKVQGPPLSTQQKTDILNSWRQCYGSGSNNSIAVLSGQMEYQSIQSNPADSQLLESRHYNTDEICRFFNILPTVIGDLQHSSYSSIEQANLQFLTGTLQPIIILLEEELTRKLINENQKNVYSIDIDERVFLRTDKQSEATYYTQLCAQGIISRNECREALGFSKVEGGDELVVPYTDINQNTIGGQNKQEEGKEEQNNL